MPPLKLIAKPVQAYELLVQRAGHPEEAVSIGQFMEVDSWKGIGEFKRIGDGATLIASVETGFTEALARAFGTEVTLDVLKIQPNLALDINVVLSPKG